MKKLASSLLILVLIFSLVSTAFAKSGDTVNSLKTSTSTVTENNNKIKNNQKEMIKSVRAFVKVTSDGKIEFKENIPDKLYKDYSLDLLQNHFNTLNDLAEAGTITINKDLSIQDNSISMMTTYGSWDYHWWGYDRYFSNTQAKSFQNYCYTVAAGATIVTGASAYFPPVAAIAGMQAGYWALVGTRVGANNHGNGVYVAVSWLAVFNVSPL